MSTSAQGHGLEVLLREKRELDREIARIESNA